MTGAPVRPARPARPAPLEWAGLLPVDKPGGMTSHDVVSRARRVLGTRAIGHLGTLDPGHVEGFQVLVVKPQQLSEGRYRGDISRDMAGDFLESCP